MNYSSRAIALTYFKYSESSIIAKLFTEENGLQSFIVKGVRSKSSKKKLVAFQPLQLSQINASLILSRNIQSLSSINLTPDQINTSINIKNNFLGLFIAEVLSKILQERVVDKALFQYIWNIKIELGGKVNSNYALLFLLNLSKFFGISPSTDNLLANYFDLAKGEFSENKSRYTLSLENSKYLKIMLTQSNQIIPSHNRSELLKSLIDYYKLHDHELKNITSHLIIESLKT